MAFRISHPFLFGVLFVSLVLIAEPAAGYAEPNAKCIGPCTFTCYTKCIEDCNARCAAHGFKYGYCVTTSGHLCRCGCFN
ncbi:hypothetical protein VNO78_16199 [Psophocarpus tetragonolobus]|uniref:Uncharacterized protein n=1 Tax=Psophocarpus tetragonolobus TaxID=3891 RepID=A0AAN9SHW4_PSOTE